MWWTRSGSAIIYKQKAKMFGACAQRLERVQRDIRCMFSAMWKRANMLEWCIFHGPKYISIITVISHWHNKQKQHSGAPELHWIGQPRLHRNYFAVNICRNEGIGAGRLVVFFICATAPRRTHHFRLLIHCTSEQCICGRNIANAKKLCGMFITQSL